MSQSHEARALRVMIEDLRAEPPPELPWDSIEERLFSRIDRDQKVIALRPVRVSSPLPRVLGMVAAAAAIALGISGGFDLGSFQPASAPRAAERAPVAKAAATPRQIDASRAALAPGEAGAQGHRDLEKLDVGDVVEAGAEPVTFARAGLAAWTLMPGSVARIRSMGDRASGVGHTIALERGAVRAEVTPRDPSEGLVEAFAVEIQGTRVAVHGTAFSVTIEDARATVDVEHGAVAVGPVGHVGATTGHLLVGPARASFSLDGGRSARMLPRASVAVPAVVAAVTPAPVAQPVAAPARVAPEPPEPPRAAQAEPPVAAPAPIAAAHPAHVEQPEAPAPKPPAPVEAPAPPAATPPLTVDIIRARLDRCFRSAYEPGSSSVQISVSSTFKLQLHEDGSVRSARFDPPLKPELVACAGGAIAGRFATGGGSVDIPVSFKP